MTKATLEDKLAQLPVDVRADVEAEGAKLIAREMTLRELRNSLGITQDVLAASLGVRQTSVSKVERRGKVNVETLHNHVRAMGGTLTLVARFPGRELVAIKVVD